MGLGILQYQHEVIRRSNVSLTKDIMTIRALIHSFLMHTFQYNNQVSSHKLTPSTHASITHAHIPLQQQSSSAEQKMQKRLSHKRTPSIQYIQYIITHAHTPIQQPSSSGIHAHTHTCIHMHSYILTVQGDFPSHSLHYLFYFRFHHTPSFCFHPPFYLSVAI